MRLGSVNDRLEGRLGPLSPAVRHLLYARQVDTDLLRPPSHGRLTKRELLDQLATMDRTVASAPAEVVKPSAGAAVAAPVTLEVSVSLPERPDNDTVVVLTVEVLAKAVRDWRPRASVTARVTEADTGRTVEIGEAEMLSHEGISRRLEPGAAAAVPGLLAAAPADAVVLSVVAGLPVGVTALPAAAGGEAIVVSIGQTAPVVHAVGLVEGGTGWAPRHGLLLRIAADADRGPTLPDLCRMARQLGAAVEAGAR